MPYSTLLAYPHLDVPCRPLLKLVLHPQLHRLIVVVKALPPPFLLPLLAQLLPTQVHCDLLQLRGNMGSEVRIFDLQTLHELRVRGVLAHDQRHCCISVVGWGFNCIGNHNQPG